MSNLEYASGMSHQHPLPAVKILPSQIVADSSILGKHCRCPRQGGSPCCSGTCIHKECVNCLLAKPPSVPLPPDPAMSKEADWVTGLTTPVVHALARLVQEESHPQITSAKIVRPTAYVAWALPSTPRPAPRRPRCRTIPLAFSHASVATSPRVSQTGPRCTSIPAPPPLGSHCVIVVY